MSRNPGFPRLILAAAVAAALALLAIVLLPRKPAASHLAPAGKPAEGEGANDGSTASGTFITQDEAARRAAIAAQGAVKHRGTNAADLYKQAATLWAQLTPAEKDILKNRNKAVSPDEAAALYAKLQPIMDLLRNARKADYTDWNMGSMNPWTDLTARIQTERDLSTMALWESGYRFQNDSAGAVSDLDALETMGRNNVDGLLGLVLDNNIHSNIVNLLAQNAASLGNASSADLSDLLNSASITQSFQSGFQAEAAMQQAMMNDYNNPATRGQSYIQSAISQLGVSAPTTATIQWMMQTEQAIAASLAEPNAQYQQWWSQQLSQAPSMPASEQAFLPSLDNIRTKAQASLVEDAMFQAGLALEQNDQATFQSILDPVTGQPFTYTQTATGFQLGSTIQSGGKPVTLDFSTPPAK